MKVFELLEILQGCVKRHPDMLEREVVIDTAKHGIPTRFMSEVKQVSPGFDWTNNLFIIYPNNDLLPVNKLQTSVRKAGEERLKQIDEACSKTGFDYGIKKTQRSSWVDGFCEGVMMYVTDVDKPKSAKEIRESLGLDETSEEQQENNLEHNLKE